MLIQRSILGNEICRIVIYLSLSILVDGIIGIYYRPPIESFTLGQTSLGFCKLFVNLQNKMLSTLTQVSILYVRHQCLSSKEDIIMEESMIKGIRDSKRGTYAEPRS
jgi:hypothetical protein